MRRKSGLEYLTSPTKRRLDLVGSVAIAATLLPAETLAAVLSAADTGANPFFKQSRVGRKGQTFDIYKLRTIAKTAPDKALEIYGTHDPRASLLGQAIREIGFDETPQLINVLRGEMSLVGIRPLLQVTIDELEDISPRLFRKWYPIYAEIKPSLTGPSQIYRHGFRRHTHEVMAESMRLDLDYVRNASLINDLRILGSTPLQLLNARIHMVDNSTEAMDPTAIAANT